MAFKATEIKRGGLVQLGVEKKTCGAQRLQRGCKSVLRLFCGLSAPNPTVRLHVNFGFDRLPAVSGVCVSATVWLISKPEALVRFVAEQCNIEAGLGVKGRRGILQNMRTRAEFLHDPDHRIRFVYTPCHCSLLNQIEIWFSKLSRRLLSKKSYCSVSCLKASIRRIVDGHSRTANPYKWTYSGIPLVARYDTRTHETLY